MQKIILKITEEEKDALKDNVECYILSTSLSKDYLAELINKAVQSRKIILLEGENAVKLCEEFGAEGVILDLSKSEDIKKDYQASTKGLDKDKIIGIITRNRRHEAMLVSEQEPDFVIFKVWKDGVEKVQDLVAWYSEFFLIQSTIQVEEELNYKDFQSDIVILLAKKEN